MYHPLVIETLIKAYKKELANRAKPDQIDALGTVNLMDLFNGSANTTAQNSFNQLLFDYFGGPNIPLALHTPKEGDQWTDNCNGKVLTILKLIDLKPNGQAQNVLYQYNGEHTYHSRAMKTWHDRFRFFLEKKV